MMNTTLPYAGFGRLYFVLSLLLLTTATGLTQDFKGRDGNVNYNGNNQYIFNRYTALASTAASGSLSFTVADINQLAGSHSFTYSANPYQNDALGKGDLVMIIQMQGADIETGDNAGYGAITNYHSTGLYELRTVYQVSGNTVLLCENLSHTYTVGNRSRVQVVRVPRFQNLSIGSNATVTGLPWNGATGGIVAIEAEGTVTLNGIISANALGFRGGVDDKTQSSASGSAVVSLYRTNVTNSAATKGESIAGNAADYNTYLNGANGRGAPANGGGGGNGHNAGGGGGANAGRSGALLPWNGTGIKNTSGTGWANAWNLEFADFASNISTGGGRGGYSFSNTNQDALTLGPSQNAWGGDKRQIVGGFGGRPLDYSSGNRLFPGGGGGAGDGNNNSSGNGGNGGGIVYIQAMGQVSGSGQITANGQNGFNTEGSNIDAAGGAGAGGAIAVLSNTGVSGISLIANGGKGGDQLSLSGEAEGPGGGGGGGFVISSHSGLTCSVAGGSNGNSYSAHVTEFTPNGATMGAEGTILSSGTYQAVLACNESGFILPVKLQQFTGHWQTDLALLQWVSEEGNQFSHYELERSRNGDDFIAIATIFGNELPGAAQAYTYRDRNAQPEATHYYRLKMVNRDGSYSYSAIQLVNAVTNPATLHLKLFPNPTRGDIQVQIPASWQGKTLRIEILDLAGRMIKQSVIGQAAPVEKIELSGLASGLYIFRTTGANGQSQAKFSVN